MTITLDLSPAAEKQIEESIAQHDAQKLQRLLTEAIPSTVDRLINRPRQRLTVGEFQEFIKRLTTRVETTLHGQSLYLSDYAMSRESIYEDHP